MSLKLGLDHQDLKVYKVSLLAHLSRRLKGELIIYQCSGVRRRRCRQPFSNMNISEASRPNAIKFYLNHHWGGGKASCGYGGDQFRTLVSIATDSSHRVIMGKRRHHVFSNVFDRILFILADKRCMRACMSLKFGRIRPRTSCP